MERLETERAFLQQEYDDVEAKDSMLKYQLSEIQQIHEELEGQMQDMKLANENLVYPELQKLKDSMANMDKELRRNADETERDGQTKKRLIKIYEDLQEEVSEEDLGEDVVAMEHIMNLWHIIGGSLKTLICMSVIG